MRDSPRILAVIPARGGSKRLPGKNILPLGGKPLIVWSIEVAKRVPEVCDVLVSTDAPDIARVASHAGAYVPWLRPADLATDSASSADVALHALESYELERGSVDGLMLLQPTSPFRTQKSVSKGVRLFLEADGVPVLGVSAHLSFPEWNYRMEDGYLVPASEAAERSAHASDGEGGFVVNGTFYLVSPAHLRATRSFTARKTIPLVIESDAESLDIDTAFDFAVARVIAQGEAP